MLLKYFLKNTKILLCLSDLVEQKTLRACSHEPETVNYPGVMIAPGQALPCVHMMICCPGAMLPRGKFIEI